jgi:hypothetical protein
VSDEGADLLEREAAGRRRATFAAAGAALLQVAAQLMVIGPSRDAPEGGPGAVLELPAFYRDNATELIGVNLVLGSSYLCAALALDYLFGAARARRPETPGAARLTAYVGALGLAVSLVIAQLIVTRNAEAYLDSGEASYFAARGIVETDEIRVAGAVSQGARFALAFGFVLISLNAMRAGLLTRFMGILGVIAGVLLAIPQLAPTPIVLWFWLGALALLFAGRWPGGVPPAWRTGRAEPWPTAKELREQREREQSGATAVEPADQASDPADTPAAPRRRRKKRR